MKNVTIPETRIRPTVNAMREYSDDGDIFVGDLKVEVKERKLRFTGPHDFPYPTMIVDVLHKDPADVYIFTSPDMHAMVLGGEGYESWETKQLWDRGKRRYRNFVLAPVAEAVGWDEGVARFFPVSVNS